MIPYDELVMALRSWRERNGMSTSSFGSTAKARNPPPAPGRPSERNVISDDQVVESADVDEYAGDYSMSFDSPGAKPPPFVAASTEPNGWAGHPPAPHRRR